MLRGFAALLVVLFHTQKIFGAHTANTPFFGMFNGGFRGVDLFFVLSGFIIFYVHQTDLGHPGRLGHYLFNRITRIYPAVWIMSCFALALYLSGYGGADKAAKLGAYNIAASFLLLPQFSDALVNVTWTLKYEVFFYLVFAVLIVNRRAGLVIFVLWQIIALFVSQFLNFDRLGLAGFYATSLCLEFTVGIGCAVILSRTMSKTPKIQPILLWSLLCAGIVIFGEGMGTEPDRDSQIAHLGVGLLAPHAWSASFLCVAGSACLIVSLVLLERSGRIAPPKPLVYLGNASYSIYIVHYSVITLLAGIAVHFHLPIDNLVCLMAAGIAVCFGCLFHSLIDRPLQARLRGGTKPVVLREAAP